jgi:hypothetical protein
MKAISTSGKPSDDDRQPSLILSLIEIANGACFD